jgi:hypothetical protein
VDENLLTRATAHYRPAFGQRSVGLVISVYFHACKHESPGMVHPYQGIRD